MNYLRRMDESYLSEDSLRQLHVTYSSPPNFSPEERGLIIENEKLNTISTTFSSINIPLSILRNNSSLEVIVLYLKDVLGLKFVQISTMLNRNQRTIWATYNNAKRKNIPIISDKDSMTIPIYLLSSRSFSVLETIVFYLKSTHGLSFNQISSMLGKNYRTIWTVYNRMLKKMHGAEA